MTPEQVKELQSKSMQAQYALGQVHELVKLSKRVHNDLEWVKVCIQPKTGWGEVHLKDRNQPDFELERLGSDVIRTICQGVQELIEKTIEDALAKAQQNLAEL